MIVLRNPVAAVAAVAAGDVDDRGRAAVGFGEHPNAQEDMSRVGCVCAAVGADSTASYGSGEAIVGVAASNLRSWQYPSTFRKTRIDGS